MLQALCGNKTVQKILIFLFVNGKCYGTQLHRFLKTPLTPLQKALLRLEKGGIIHSYYEGKTRLYHFNTTYPLLPELEQLLKKTYTLLPAQEKKDYYVPPENRAFKFQNQDSQSAVLFAFWKKLSEVSQLSFTAKSKSKGEQGWNGKGKGEVAVTKEGDYVLLFAEKGNWQGTHGEETSFSNVFRWTLDRFSGMISLEHLRRGINHPVFLLHLAPTSKHTLSSIDSHLCEGDIYLGQIHFDSKTIRLNWRVIGPRKNEEMDYYYT
jgi:hypothetical protein